MRPDLQQRVIWNLLSLGFEKRILPSMLEAKHEAIQGQGKLTARPIGSLRSQ